MTNPRGHIVLTDETGIDNMISLWGTLEGDRPRDGQTVSWEHLGVAYRGRAYRPDRSHGVVDVTAAPRFLRPPPGRTLGPGTVVRWGDE